MAGGFTTFGVALKIGYSAVAVRRATNAAGLDRFGDQRRQIYERFYDLVQKQLKRDRALSAFVEAHHKEGEAEISDEEKETVPPTFLGPLLAAMTRSTTSGRSTGGLLHDINLAIDYLDFAPATRWPRCPARPPRHSTRNWARLPATASGYPKAKGIKPLH